MIYEYSKYLVLSNIQQRNINMDLFRPILHIRRVVTQKNLIRKVRKEKFKYGFVMI